MTRLTVALRNFLVQAPEVQNLVSAGTIGSGRHWSDGWVFADLPYATIEKYSARAMVVITETGNYDIPNPYNTEEFPRLWIDVWASPTRDADGSPVAMDADNVMRTVFEAIKPYVHTVNAGVHTSSPAFMGPRGWPIQWGTADEIASFSGVFITGSQFTAGPVVSPVGDGNGAIMGRYTCAVGTIN